MKLCTYIKRLVIQGQRWQYLSITEEFNDKPSKPPKLYFTGLQIVFIICSGAQVIFFEKGFTPTFAGYLITGLAIFIGIYISLIIMLFDKFSKLDYTVNGKTWTEKTNLLKKKNFFLQFSSLTSYSILLAILIIILLTPSFLGEDERAITCLALVKEFALMFEDHNLFNTELLLKTIAVVTRGLVVYFLLDFVMILVYAISSMYSYMSREFTDIKINK